MMTSHTPTHAPRAPSVGHVAMRPALLRIPDFCAASGLGRTTVYGLIASGRLKSVMIAGRRLIPTTELDRLEAEATNPGA
jgi:excisionase family DNA binding protein